MPLIDSDTVIVRRATRTGTNQQPTNIDIEIEWKDAEGVSQGVFSTSWSTLDEFKNFLAGQEFDDVIRALMTQCIQRSDGTFRPAVFSGLAGKTYTVNTKVTQV